MHIPKTQFHLRTTPRNGNAVVVLYCLFETLRVYEKPMVYGL